MYSISTPPDNNLFEIWMCIKNADWVCVRALKNLSLVGCYLTTFVLPYSIDVVSTLSNLAHWGRVTHICVGNTTIIGLDSDLLPGRRQAINWTNARILSIGPFGTNFCENLIEIHISSSKKMHLKMSGKWRPFSRPQCVKTNKSIG